MKKISILAILAGLALAGCSLFEPKKSETEYITEEVLKAGQGIDIKIEPIQELKK